MKRSEDLAWAIGLFEGEGSVFIHYRLRGGLRQPAVAADLTMIDEDVVRRFHSVVGMGRVQSRPPARDGWRPTYAWRLKGKRNVETFIDLLYEGLGERRKDKANEVLAECRRPQTRRPPTPETRRKISEALKRRACHTIS